MTPYDACRAQRHYDNRLRTAEDPRAAEVQILARLTRAVEEASGPDGTFPAFAQAIHENRRFWAAWLGCLGAPGNQLSEETRARLISIGLWVQSHSREVLAGRGDAGELIEVNRTIAAGLAPAPDAQRDVPEEAPHGFAYNGSA